MHVTYKMTCKNRPANFVLAWQLMFAAFLIVLSGCQSTRDSRLTENSIGGSNITYGQYYLLISQFNEQQLSDEIHYIKALPVGKTENISRNLVFEQQLKSVIAYALPKSPIHNPFTAKSKLNQLALDSLDSARLTPSDFAFFAMLKKQLNQQIILLNKLTLVKKSRNKIKNDYLQQQIELQQLQQQIIQLKNLETNINEHGR